MQQAITVLGLLRGVVDAAIENILDSEESSPNL